MSITRPRPGGDGSVTHPFSTLASAQNAAGEAAIIYVHTGNGTSAGQNTGITLGKAGQQLIGAGVDFIYDGSRFTTQNGKALSGGSLVIAQAGTAPVITNGGGDGISITADNVSVTGVTVSGAGRDGIEVSGNNAFVYSVESKNNTRHGIYALNVANPVLLNISATGNTEDGIRLEASGAGHTLSNAALSNVTATGNKNGVRFYAQDDATVSGAMMLSKLSGNTQQWCDRV
ncbi:MAG: right-handed parallel beta-helix repeat-containing protein [Alphaproteobacteria bacterium]|nr:right-handed parallel beta-helix repeat-containing protein [Alphaproteobacteria bacterium]